MKGGQDRREGGAGGGVEVEGRAQRPRRHLSPIPIYVWRSLMYDVLNSYMTCSVIFAGGGAKVERQAQQPRRSLSTIVFIYDDCLHI